MSRKNISAPPSTLGQRIAYAREAKGLKQDEVASRLGVSRSAYSFYETDRTPPKHLILKQMAEMFEVSEDWLGTPNSATNAINISGESASMMPDWAKRLLAMMENRFTQLEEENLYLRQANEKMLNALLGKAEGDLDSLSMAQVFRLGIDEVTPQRLAA